MNRTDLKKKLEVIVDAVLRERGHVSMIDVLLKLGYLSDKDYQDWRMRRIPDLERKIGVNLGKVSFILDTTARRCREIGLNPSLTAYRKWGKGPKQPLRFSRSGAPSIEQKYSTHWVPRKAPEVVDAQQP